MKKILTIFACFCFLLVGGIALTACGEAKLTGIKVDAQEAHTAYVTGDAFSTEGLKVKAVYDNKTEKDLELEKVTVSEATKGETKIAAGEEFEEIGTYTVTVSYEYETGKFFTDTYDVTVTYLEEEGGVALVEKEADLEVALAHYSSAKLKGDVVLTKPFEVAKEFTLDLDTHTIKNETEIYSNVDDHTQDKWSLISVKEGGKLTLKGTTGGVVAKENDCYAVDVDGGELTIDGGKYNGNSHTVYVFKGKLTVNGGEFDIQTENKDYLLNCYNTNYQSGDAEIVVKGGTFHNFNPADNKAENLAGGTNYVADGFKVEKTTGNVWTVVEAENYRYAKDVDTLTAALAHDNAYVVLTSDITVDTQKIFTVTNNNVTLDLAGHKISNTVDLWSDDKQPGCGENDKWSLVSVRGGQLTVKGNGQIVAKANDVYAIDVCGGELTIEDGTYNGNLSAVYVFEGTCTINGGEFDVQQTKNGNKNFLLNCLNENSKSGTANIVVNGGTFHGFNPAALANDDGKETYLAEDRYVEDADSTYTVREIVHVSTEADLRAELTAAKTQKVVLENDITFNGRYIQLDNAKSQITLDLNGHTLQTENSAFYIVCGAKLTIKNSKEEGKLVSTNASVALLNVGAQSFMEDWRAGSLVIESGVFESQAEVVLVNNGTAEVKGGKFESKGDRHWALNIYDKANDSQGKIEVTGGEFTNFDPSQPNTNDRSTYVKSGYTTQDAGENVKKVVEE